MDLNFQYILLKPFHIDNYDHICKCQLYIIVSNLIHFLLANFYYYIVYYLMIAMRHHDNQINP